jgi:hypothetical protein
VCPVIVAASLTPLLYVAWVVAERAGEAGRERRKREIERKTGFVFGLLL